MGRLPKLCRGNYRQVLAIMVLFVSKQHAHALILGFHRARLDG